MKNLKSLQVVALAGLAVAFGAGCSSTSAGRASNNSSDPNAAYRFVSAGGWMPITDTRKTIIYPLGWTPDAFGPVSYETYVITPPAVGETAAGSAAMATTSSGSSTTVTSNGSTTTVTTGASPEFNENLQPGDTFVEAAGANSDSATVRRVMLYSPFNSAGVGH